MKKSIKYTLIGIVAAALLAFIVLRIIDAAKPVEPKKQLIPPVRVAKPVVMDITYKLDYDGDVLPILQANIFSKVAGTLEAVYTDMGKTVKSHQLIALIDTAALYQTLKQSEAAYFNAKATEARTRKLAGDKLVSQQDLDNAVATLQATKATYDASAILLDYAKIRSPFHGFVTKRFLDPGVVVSTNPVASNSNTTIFTVMDLDTVKIDINVLDRDVQKISQIKKAIATVDVIPGREFQAFVARSSQAVSTTTRTMTVEMLIPNKDEMIKPGEFAHVTLVLGEKPNAITVPQDAVLRDNAGTYVYVVRDTIAVRRDVKTGVTDNGRLEILSGLDGSEDVIVTGQTFVRAKGKVTVVKNAPASDTTAKNPGDTDSSPAIDSSKNRQ